MNPEMPREMSREPLGVAQTQALRGVAILGIVLHNYCHFLGFAVKENEYTFTASRPRDFMARLACPDHDLFVHAMSFLGHYGVPVFLFVSGYCLVLKYERGGNGGTGALPFVGRHYAKLLRLMFLGYIGFVVVSLMHLHGYRGYTFGRVMAQLLMYINLLPHPDRIIRPGPYWFFGLMLQLYVAYRLLLYRRPSWWTLALVAVCWAVQAAFPPSLDPGGETLNRIRYNMPGSMLPFGLGILYARHGVGMAAPWRVSIVAVSALGVLLGGLCFQSWLWVPLFVVSGAVATVGLLPGAALRPLVWAGGISAALFVMHPIAREMTIGIARRGHVYPGILAYLAASVLLAYVLKVLLKRIGQ